MATKEQILAADEFHYGSCIRKVGPRGGITIEREVWHRNGKTKTWKTRPDEFRIPIKYGLREYSAITDGTADFFHIGTECPLNTPDEITPEDLAPAADVTHSG